MAKKYTIDILLNLLTEGAGKFADLEKEVKSLSRVTKKSEKDTKDSLDKMARRFSNSSKNFEELAKNAEYIIKTFGDLKSASPDNIIDPIAIKQTVDLLSQNLVLLRKTREELKKSGQNELAVQVQEQIKTLEDGRSVLKKYSKDIEEFNRTEVTPKINNRISLELQSLAKDLDIAKKKAEDFNNVVRNSNKQSLIDTSGIPKELNLIDDLIVRINSARLAYDTLGKNKDTGIDSELNKLISGAGDLREALDKTYNSAINLNKVEITPNIKTNVAEGLREVNKEINNIKKSVYSATKKGSLLSDSPNLLNGTEKVLAKIDELRTSAASLGLNTQAFDNAEARILDYTSALDKSDIELRNLDEAARKSNIDLLELKNTIKSLTSETSSLEKEISKSTANGTLFQDAPKHAEKLLNLANSLDTVKNAAKGTDVNIDGVDSSLLKIKDLIDFLDKTEAELKKLDSTVKNNRIDNLIDLEKDKQELKDIEKELAETLKEVIKLKKEGKTVEIVTTYKKKFEDFQGKVAKFAEKNTNNSLLPNIARASIRSSEAANFVQSIEKTLPTSSAGKALAGVGQQIKGVLNAAGGQKAVFTSIATGLRLMGTSAFAAGGQLKTAGFAFNALASILQNFAPILVRMLAAAGPAAPIIAGIGLAAVVAGVQLAGFVAGMTAIIANGLAFSSAVQVAQNNVAGLINEFFEFEPIFNKENGIPEKFQNASKEVIKFAAAQEIASKALDKLQLDALTTNFTFQELLDPFKAVVTALGSANTDILKAEEVAIGFARVGGLVGYDSQKIATSISEVLAGVGRSTNAIQRLFNGLKDSEGVALTAKRIRELRSSDPAKLLEEISKATTRLTAEAAKANAKTLPGILSNFRDLFDIFSGKAVNNGLNSLAGGLLKTLDEVYNKFVPIDNIINGKTSSPLTKNAEKLLEFVSAIAELILTDIGQGIATIADWVLNLGVYFEQNKNTILLIYEKIKLIVLAVIDVFDAVGELISALFISNKEWGAMDVILSIILKTLQFINTLIYASAGEINVISLGATKLFQIIIKGLKKILEFSILPDSVNNKIGGFLDDKLKYFEDTEKQTRDNLAEIDQKYYQAKEALLSDTLVRNTGKDGKSNVFEDMINSLKKGNAPEEVKKVGRQVLKSYLAYYDELISLAKSRNDLLLEETQARADKELDIITKQHDLGLRAQSDFNKKEAELSKQRLNFQKEVLAVEEQIVRAKLDIKNPASINNAFNREVARLKAEFDQKGTKEGEDRSGELAAKIEDLNNKRNKEILSTQQELEKIESRKRLLEAEIPKINLDLAVKEYQRIKDIRKQVLDLGNDVYNKSGELSNSELENIFIAQAVSEITDEFRKNKLEVDATSKKIEEFSKLLANASSTQKEGLENSIELLKAEKIEYETRNELLLKRIALEVEAARIQRIDSNVSRLQAGLRREEDSINRDVTRGLLNQQEAIVEITAARKRYKIALTEELQKLQQISQTRPLDLNQVERVKELEDQINSLNDVVTESVLLNINQEVGNGLIDFLEKVQENVGNTASAFKDLGNVFLKAFRKTIAQQIVSQFFEPIIGKLGQTEGKAQGFLADFLRNLGIDPATRQNKQATDLARDGKGRAIGSLNSIEKDPVEEVAKITERVRSEAEARISEENKFLGAFNNAVQKSTDSLTDLGQIVIGLFQATKDAFNFVKSNGGNLNGDLGTKGLNQSKQPIFNGVLGNDSININQIKARLKTNKSAFSNGKSSDSTLRFADLIQQAGLSSGFSAFNDLFHKGKDSRHPLGQAFDFTLKNPSDSVNAAKTIQALADSYGYIIKLKNEYIDPSKDSTGGHLHVSVLGRKKVNDLGQSTTIDSITENLPLNESVNSLSNELNQIKIDLAGTTDAFNEKISFLQLPQFDTSLGISIESIKAQISIIGQLSNTFSSLGSTVAEVIQKITNIPNTPSTGNTTESNSAGGTIDKVVGIVDTFVNLFGGTKKADGGFISGKGGKTQDMIPAMLSNGEYVIKSDIVQKLGKAFFDKLNNRKYADGGFVLPDITKYNYSKGGASLKELPKMIEYVKPQEKKKPSLFRRIFGGALSFAAPFLNLIPGIGPFLSIAAGAAGGALSGTDLKSSLVGGLLGGLSNFGGFAGKGGTFGKIADFMKKGKVQDILGIVGGSLGNGSSGLNYLGNSIFNQYFGKTKKAMGGYIRKPKRYAFGGFVEGFKGIFGKLFGKSGVGITGDGIADGGSKGFLSKIFGAFGGSGGGEGLGQIMGLFSGLFGGGNSSKPDDFESVNPSGYLGSADPDYLRKNLYGSAYDFLGDNGQIAKFNYTKDILDFIDVTYNSTGDKVKTGGKNILGTLGGIASTILSLFALNKKVNPYNTKKFSNLRNQFTSGNFKEIPAKAEGGLVSGAGTSMSDSIPAMLSNGEYVVRAAAVNNIGLRTLDYINSGRVKLAAGGLVGEGIDSIDSSNNGSGVNVDARTKIINVLDQNLLQDYLNTSDGTRTLINLITNNRSKFKSALQL